MKISLISPYPDITSFGLRCISSYLKEQGHSSQMIFLPDPYGDNLIHGIQRYKEHVIDEVVSLCKGSDLIGITLMTNFFTGTVQITKKLKKQLDIPVIWGGVHATIRPEECLQYADIICVGDGEDALLELVDKMSKGEDYSNTNNLCINQAGKVLKNQLRPLRPDLDIYPFPDYSMDDHHIMVNGGMVPLTHEVTEAFLKQGTVSKYLGKTGYQTMTSRGCPYSCAYCINNTINKMYGGKGKLRWRSVGHVIQELSWVKSNMPYVDYIWLSDDEFMARKIDNLEEFSIKYKQEIGLPFSCLLSPISVTEEKMALLVEAGLIYVQMGVESGSARMQKIFNRKHMNNARMMKAMHIINKFKDKMHAPSYDFLIDAPYETDKDRIESLRFISEIPKPFRLQPFTLILYPGTQLYEMAKQNGFIKDENKEIYSKSYTMREPNYLNLLMTLSKGGRFPRRLLKIFIHPPLLNILNSNFLKPMFKFLYLGLKKIYNLAKRVYVGT
jgi:anaerobic magnesium-protoporphyrin IX monomethyl ester cyclase